METSRLRAPVAVGLAGLAACGYLYAVDPSQPGHYPGCPTKLLTGFDCPFCGSLRATHELLHGNVAAAMDYNALAVLLLLPVTAVALGVWAVRRVRPQTPALTVPRWAVTSTVVLMVVFTVVRNLPGMPLGTSA